MRKFRRVFVWSATATALLFAYNNCGLITTPRVEDMSMASVGYQHSGLESNCASCHEKTRPAAKAGVVHGNGADCINCHNQISWFRIGAFMHAPVPTSCTFCHLTDRPEGPTGNLRFDHARSGQADCVLCHVKTVGVTFAGASYTHSPPPTECASCHSNLRPIGLAGTPPFDHAQGGQGDCVSCHKNPGVTWAGGSFSHSPAPATCAGCHEGRKPVALTNKMFHNSTVVKQDCAACHKNPGVSWAAARFHANANPPPGSCVDCHTPQRPVGLVGNPPFNHALGGSGDCFFCHKSPGVTWTGGRFNHVPAPTTCISCHLGRRPVGLIGTPPFDHALGGTGDCVSCHKSPGVTWAGGSFSHTPKPATCKDCHIGSQPTMLINRMSHTGTFVAQDCTACHKNPGVVWSGGKFHMNLATQPTSCNACHTTDRPIGVVGTRGFNHANGGTGDCFGCHKSPGVTWAGGLIAHAPVPASCNQCHTVDRPTTTQYPGSRTAVAGHYNGKDCYACHMPASTTIKQFLFQHSNARNQNINFCLPCHLSDGISEHGANGGGEANYTGDGNCYNCHNSRKSWDE